MDCGFCQLGFVVRPELMYNKNYSYDGSATIGLRQHHISIANQICDMILSLDVVRLLLT